MIKMARNPIAPRGVKMTTNMVLQAPAETGVCTQMLMAAEELREALRTVPHVSIPMGDVEC